MVFPYYPTTGLGEKLTETQTPKIKKKISKYKEYEKWNRKFKRTKGKVNPMDGKYLTADSVRGTTTSIYNCMELPFETQLNSIKAVTFKVSVRACCFAQWITFISVKVSFP